MPRRGDLLDSVGIRTSPWGDRSFYVHRYIGNLLNSLYSSSGYRVGLRIDCDPATDQARESVEFAAGLACVAGPLHYLGQQWVASMHDITFPQAQADMRLAYLHGAPGILASGLAWLVAGLVALWESGQHAVLALLVGGALIHPAGVLICKLMGRTGAHRAGNPLARLAIEGTAWLLAGIAIAYGMHVLRLAWFFPAMLLLIGGRYLTFQTLYGLRVYWALGATLCAVGLLMAVVQAPVPVSALTGAAIELVFAAVVLVQARGQTGAAPAPRSSAERA